IAWTVADPLIAGAVYDWDTALQLTLMNGEAFAVSTTVLGISQAIVRRERPIVRVCSDPKLAADLRVDCSSDNRGFIGGHVGTVATAATLTCIHHAYLPLWSSREAGYIPCVSWSALTFMVLTSRTVTG